MSKGVLLLIAIAAVILFMAESPPDGRISYEAAQKTALQQCRGKVKSSALEQTDSIWSYEFEIRTRAKKTCIISVDAINGAIRSKEVVLKAKPGK